MSEVSPVNRGKQLGTGGDGSYPEVPVHPQYGNGPVDAESAGRLFDAEVGADYLDEGAKHYAKTKVESQATGQSVLVFRIASEWFALPTAIFQEVAPCRPVHSLPHRRVALVSGIVNVRGELLVCLSLPAALGFDVVEGEQSSTARHVVVGSGSDRFVFEVIEVAGVVRHDEEKMIPVPATVSHAQAVHTRGLLLWRDQQVGLLDEGLLFHTFNRGMS